jgi:hypothetical protein
MSLLKQSTARTVNVLMVQSDDHVTGATGLTLTITASKAGAAFASITPIVTERGNGWYAIALTAVHTDTLNDLALHITGAAADPLDVLYDVRLSLPGEDSASVAAIKAQTDNLPTDPADESLIIAATTAIQNAIAALNNLSPAGVRTAIGLSSANLDAQLDALPTAAENAAGLLDLVDAIEAGVSPRAALRIALAVLAGKSAGLDSGSITFRNIGDSKTRVTATGDAFGNRTATAVDGS